METDTYENKKHDQEKQHTIDLLRRLDDRLKNAHYWLTERDAPAQSSEAIMEARGITLRLSEGNGGYIAFPANVTSPPTGATERRLK
jgi:hypothetical protein